MWIDYLIEFSKLGYLAVAMDQRGYYVSEKPAGFSNYSISVVCQSMCCYVTLDLSEPVAFERYRERVAGT